MPEEAGRPGVVVFIHQIRGTTGELASLLRITGALRKRWTGSKKAGPAPAGQQQCIDLLRTRLAQLCRSSEKKMRQAATNVGQIGKALKKQGASEDLVKQFGPVLVVLQKQIDHSRHSVQVGMEAVKGLDGLLGGAKAEEPAGAKSAKKVTSRRKAKKVASAPKTKKAASRRKAKKAASAPKAKKAASSRKKAEKAASAPKTKKVSGKTGKKAVARKRKTTARSTVARPNAGKPAPGV